MRQQVLSWVLGLVVVPLSELSLIGWTVAAYLPEQAHDENALIGADRATGESAPSRLGVSTPQMPILKRRDPRAVPGGNLTDPF